MPLTRYLTWRTALLRFGCPPPVLEAHAVTEVAAQVARERHIIERALATPEAAAVVADPEVVSAAVADFLARQPDMASFRAGGLDEAGVAEAVAAELRAGQVLERIGAVRVDEAVVRAFYERRRAEFVMPERRSARHILVTVNERFEENRRECSEARMREAQALIHGGTPFAEVALRFSECPSALEGGRLGEVRRGQLYAELDNALFAMRPGELRRVESGLGLHLLLCEAIIPPQPIDFTTAAPSIRRRLEQRARDHALKSWLKRAGE